MVVADRREGGFFAGGEGAATAAAAMIQSLVYRRRLAQSADASANLQEDVGLFSARAVMASGKKPEDGIAARPTGGGDYFLNPRPLVRYTANDPSQCPPS